MNRRERVRDNCPAHLHWGVSPSFGRPGFSLVEVVLALCIFVFAIIGIIGLLPIAVETHRKAKADYRPYPNPATALG